MCIQALPSTLYVYLRPSIHIHYVYSSPSVLIVCVFKLYLSFNKLPTVCALRLVNSTQVAKRRPSLTFTLTAFRLDLPKLCFHFLSLGGGSKKATDKKFNKWLSVSYQKVIWSTVAILPNVTIGHLIFDVAHWSD